MIFLRSFASLLVLWCLIMKADAEDYSEHDSDTDLRSYTTTTVPTETSGPQEIEQIDGHMGEVEEESANCYEDDRKYVSMIIQSEWNRNSKHAMSKSVQAEFVVINDGGERCSSRKACLKNLQSLRNSNLSAPCDLRENFYVGEDGNVYEGRGWDVSPYWYLDGMRNYSITVSFMGRYDSISPDKSAMRAFRSALAIGVWMGKLSPRYKIVTIDQLSGGQGRPGESLKEDVRRWEGWVDDSVPRSRWEHHDTEALDIVMRRDWKATDPDRDFQPTRKPVEIVLVNNFLSRCRSREKCVSQLRSLQTAQREQFGDLVDNFYVGEDGSVYEGRGWGVVPQWYLQRFGNSVVSVSFLGLFQSDLPNYTAISAFKALIHAGIQLGEISPKFRFTSLRVLYDNSSLLGDKLKHYTEEWTPWDKTFDHMNDNERFNSLFVPLQKRKMIKFDTMEDDPQLYPPQLPIEFIILNEGGECCYNVSECNQHIKSEIYDYSVDYGDLLDNFYVGCDGMVYEGRSWKYLPPVYLKHTRNSYITVKFIGTHNTSKPNDLALLAFHSFIKLGIGLGKISPSYQLYSYRHIYNYSSFLGDALTEYAEGLEHWSTEMTVENDEERESKGLLPFVSREYWNSEFSPNTNEEFSKSENKSARFVIIGEIGNRCFTREQCNEQMKTVLAHSLESYGSLTDNFYVADDGSVYEGLGWGGDASESATKPSENVVYVRFLGHFQIGFPSPLAMAAFHRLMTYGLNTGKLSHDYSLMSIRQLCNCSDGIGNGLQKAIENLDRFSADSISQKFLETVHHVRYLIVPNSVEENLLKPTFNTREENLPPAEYVILFEEGVRCFDRGECGNQVKNALSTTRAGMKNFFVADDGRVYQGYGWGKNPDWNVVCPGCSLFAVGFFGNFDQDLPSANAVSAFDFLIDWGIRAGKISPDYKLISIRQVCNDSLNLGEALSTEIRKWDHWTDEINLELDCNILDGRVISPVSWGASNPIRGSTRVHKVGFIYVRDGRERCYTIQQCSALMRKEHFEVQRNYGGVLENFYIGDDGNVYEGRGWQRKPQFEFDTNMRPLHSMNQYGMTSSINVLFFGKFENESPSSVARAAFKNLIVNQGIKSGFLERSFEVRAVPDGTYSINTGKGLKNSINSLL